MAGRGRGEVAVVASLHRSLGNRLQLGRSLDTGVSCPPPFLGPTRSSESIAFDSDWFGRFPHLQTVSTRLMIYCPRFETKNQWNPEKTINLVRGGLDSWFSWFHTKL
jgi:hypothetical protein